MNRITKAMIISLLLTFFAPMAKLSAQVSIWDGTWKPWTHGTGTEADPFLIENAQQLAYLAYRVNNGLDAGSDHASNHNYHYKMMVDVDLNNLQWEPIGYHDQDQNCQYFGGHFDGDNHTISGLYINSSIQHLGLIGYTYGATITNFNIIGEIVAVACGYAGGIIGYSSGLTNITNCSFNGSITSCPEGIDNKDLYSYLGGIVGASQNTLCVDNCTCHGIVYSFTNSMYRYDSYSYAGGIVGYGEGRITITNSQNNNEVKSDVRNYDTENGGACSGGILGYGNGILNFRNCNNTGEVYAYQRFGKYIYAYAGGILGYGVTVESIVSCYNQGSVSADADCGYNSYDSYAGGMIGRCTTGNMKCCYNTANVSAHGFNSYAGGMIGIFTTGSITCCYNTANISSTGLYTISGGITGKSLGEIIASCYNSGEIYSHCFGDSWIGGIAGITEKVDNCYNVGTTSILVGDQIETTNLSIGGIAGSSNVITNSYYLNTCGGDNTAGGTSLSSREMRTDDFVSTLNNGSCNTFVRDISPNVNNGYPLLTMMDECAYTGFATDLTMISATLHGSVFADHISYDKGFEYRKAGEPSYTIVSVSGDTHDFSFVLNSLELNNTYEYRAFAHFPDCNYTAYGETKTFEISLLSNDTIYINDAETLRWISEQCNSGTSFDGKYLKLMNDIELPLNIPNNMTSIGSYPDHPFKGTFDGNGKLIYNLYIDQPNTPYQGFFGYTLNANLYNVGLVNITASGRNYTGGMVAYAENTHMRDCYVNGGTLFALSYCGGLVGYQEQGTNSIISGCYNTCTVSGNHYVGGLVGFSNYGTVRNSYVAAPVSGQGNGIGAIIGGANEVLMYYCYFSTEITGQTNAIGENNFKDGGEGLTNTQMRNQQFVATLNQGLVTPVWIADYASHINNGFPIIKWQRPGTGIEENITTKIFISLYPNPANSFVTVQSDEPNVSLKHVEVYDVMGRKVMSETLDGQAQEFCIDKLHTGIYQVRVQTDDGRNTNIKLVVQ